MKTLILLLIGIQAIILLSCGKDSLTNVTYNYSKVTEAVSDQSSFKVKLFVKDSLFMGYNKMFFKIIRNSDGFEIDNASLSLHPLMNMGTYAHSCPFENPESINGYHEGAILFSMPGINSWSIGVDIVAEGKSEHANLSISQVVSTSPVRKIVAIDSLSNGSGGWVITKYPLSLIVPKSWKIGNNPFEITAHRMDNMMDFPAVTDLNFEITPEMPSMGHGSPNNVNPVHMSNGHYLGNVNFTMTGAWRIHLLIKKGSRIISDKLFFDIIF